MITQYSNRLSSDKLAIFLFHGVIEKNTYNIRNYNRKHLEKPYFEEVISSLKEVGTPLSMDEVYKYLVNNDPFPPFSFAITFDDGFENNYSIAASILDRLDIPAVFYITTGFVQNNGMSWIDKIEYAFELKSKGELKLPWENKAIEFNDYITQKSILDNIRLNVKSNRAIDVDGLIGTIYEQLVINPISSSDEVIDKKMTWEQVRELSENGLFTIGGHTHNHSIMSFLSDKELESEVDLSLELLKNKLQKEIYHYSYPEGLAHCYSKEVISLLKNRGIKICPTAEDGINTKDTNPFLLKRISVV